MDQGDTITLTLSFSQAVTGLSLTITDIDKDTDLWIDEVGVEPRRVHGRQDVQRHRRFRHVADPLIRRPRAGSRRSPVT